MVTTLDVALLLLTVVWGLVFIVYAGRPLMKKRNDQAILWILSILALFVVGATLLLYGWDGLKFFTTPIAGMFVPGLFAAGVVGVAYKDRYGLYYAAYIVVVTIVYAVLQWASLYSLPALLLVHVPSGLIIVFVPAMAALKGRPYLWLTALGGLLISIGGVALAALTIGTPILSSDLVLAVTVPLIFLSTLCMTLGLMLTKQWLPTSALPPVPPVAAAPK